MNKQDIISGLESLKEDYLLGKCDINSVVIDAAISYLKDQPAMKIWITKTSDWDYKTVAEYESLEKCVDDLLKKEKTTELVVSKIPDYYPDEAKQCAYNVEIYDTWRE